jgi:ribosomal protein L7/L12
MATSPWLREAIDKFVETYWTEVLALRTLRYIALKHPAAFVAAFKAVEQQDKEPQAMCSAGFAEPEPVIEQPVGATYVLEIISYPPENKIKVLKAYREITERGLGISKKHIESSFPIFVCSGNFASIRAAQSVLELAGATCVTRVCRESIAKIRKTLKVDPC